ncbi:MAG TPA: FkbM family methyltransferase [Chitinophagaceae bacterium]|nr:FkbM family methyltransferase [Chitinophagaceae bacterium]
MYHLFIKLLFRLKLLPLFNLRKKIDIDGNKIRIPLFGNLGYFNFNLTEVWMTQVLRQLKPIFKGAFVDVGVNTGQTLIKAHGVFGKMEYVGFEPNPVCVHYVQNLIRLNNFNCKLLPVGVSSETGILKLNFYYDEETDQSASILQQFRLDQPIHHSLYVPVFNGQSVVQLLPAQQHSILKIDVEGAELDVLKGLQEWIVARQPIILSEILPVYTPSHPDYTLRVQRQQEMQQLLRNWDYRIARLVKNNTIAVQLLETIEPHSDMELCDYIIFPAGLQAQVLQCFEQKPTA